MTRLALFAVFMLALPTTVGAGDIYRGLDAGDVFVATIVRVHEQGATNGQPLIVWLKVHEVLRGAPATSRSPAIWSPHWHGIDWGGAERELKAWNSQPMKGPKVGEKFILGGRAIGKQANKDSPQYDLYAFIRLPYTDKARQQTIKHLQHLEELRRKSQAELAAAAEKQRRADDWRATMTDKVIDQRTRQADVVAIGKISSGSTFEIETMLKGRPRMSTGGKYFVRLAGDDFDKRIADLIYDRPRCVLFISEEHLVASVVEVDAKLIDPYEGVMPADEAVIAAVKASLQRHPPPKIRPLLVISASSRDDELPLGRAMVDTFEVVYSHQFSGHSPNTIKHVRETIPHASYLVMIDSGSAARRVHAVKIDKDDSQTLYDGSWPAKPTDDDRLPILKALKASLAK